MGLFSGNKRDKDLSLAFAQLHEELAKLQQTQALYESDFRNLKTEWMNMHDKLVSVASRLSKRQALYGEEEPQDAAVVPTEEDPPDPYINMDPVSAGIYRRRNAGRSE